MWLEFDRCLAAGSLAQASNLLFVIISCFAPNSQIEPATGFPIGPAGQITRQTVLPSSRL
jgi:hypothetical protein